MVRKRLLINHDGGNNHKEQNPPIDGGQGITKALLFIYLFNKGAQIATTTIASARTQT